MRKDFAKDELKIKLLRNAQKRLIISRFCVIKSICIKKKHLPGASSFGFMNPYFDILDAVFCGSSVKIMSLKLRETDERQGKTLV